MSCLIGHAGAPPPEIRRERDVRSATMTAGELEMPSGPFQLALASLENAELRPEITIERAPAPSRLAPYSVAITAEVEVEGEELASGRFVVLHDPAGQDEWAGTFRLVTLARAPLEPDIAGDPLFAEVGWAWLTEALTAHGASYIAASGTVTRVASEGFGGLADRPPAAEVEIRASWTPADEHLGAHLTAWGDLLCTVAGLPPASPDVTVLPPRR
jgi:DUF3000 family protein